MQLLKEISTCGASAGVFAQPRPKPDIWAAFPLSQTQACCGVVSSGCCDVSDAGGGAVHSINSGSRQAFARGANSRSVTSASIIALIFLQDCLCLSPCLARRNVENLSLVVGKEFGDALLVAWPLAHTGEPSGDARP